MLSHFLPIRSTNNFHSFTLLSEMYICISLASIWIIFPLYYISAWLLTWTTGQLYLKGTDDAIYQVYLVCTCQHVNSKWHSCLLCLLINFTVLWCREWATYWQSWLDTTCTDVLQREILTCEWGFEVWFIGDCGVDLLLGKSLLLILEQHFFHINITQLKG